jgi:hypothetical protein
LIFAVFAFQLYQSFFHSWISDHWDSSRAALLESNLGGLESVRTLFLYDVPEAYIFVPHRNIYQYFRFSDNVIRGQENLELIANGTADYLLVDQKFTETPNFSDFYHIKSKFDKYVLYEKSNI